MAIIDLAPIFATVTSLFLLRKTSAATNIFNPFVYFFWTYFLFCFSALFYRDIYTYALTISDKTIIIVSLGLIFLSAGGILANHSTKKTESHKPIESLIAEASKAISTKSGLVYILIAIPIALSILFTIKAGKILWLSDSFDDERIVLRQGAGWISILGISSAYVATIYSALHFYKKKSLIKLLVTTIALSLCAISYGNRAPGFEIIVIGGIFIWISLFKRVTLTHFTAGFITTLALVMILGVIRQGLDFNFESVYKQMLWRPFTNIQNTEWIISFIPYYHDFFYGKSILIDLAVLMPGYQPNFGTYMKEVMGKEFSGGSITLSFLGQAYSDFGLIASLLLILALGYFLQKIFITLSKKGKWLPFLIVISITTKSMTSSGITSPIIYTLIPCGIFLAIWLSLKSISSKKPKPQLSDK